MKDKPTLILPTNITPLNADWRRISFLSAVCCYSNPINDEQREQVPILTDKLNSKELGVAFTQITQTHQRLLRKITLVLNAIHGTNFSVRFWGIQLGLPFLYLIATVYERRFRLLQAADKLRGQEWHLATPKDQQLIFHTPNHFSNRMADRTCAGDWILYADIAHAENLPTVRIDLNPPPFTDQIRANPAKGKFFLRALIKSLIKSILLSGGTFLNRATNFTSKYSCPKIFVTGDGLYISLLIRSKFKLKIIPNPILDFSAFPRDDKLRTKFNNIIAESDFEQTLIKLLPKYIPVSLVEGFTLVQEAAEPYVAAGLYFLSNGTGNIIYNYAAATAVDLFGANFTTIQHGGGDGVHQIFFPEYFARRYSDYFLTFGWQDSHYEGATIIPLPSVGLSRMVNKKPIKVIRDKGLFVSTGGVPYINRGDHWATMEGFEIYFDDQQTFFSHLKNDVRKYLEYRPYPDPNLGWGKILDRMKERFPEVLVAQNREIVDALNAAKIIVIDHNITTLLDAMAMNRPTVCYWQPLLFPLRHECVEDFEQLRKVGILYDDPVSAAQHVNSIWQTVDEWWQSDELQKARDTFVAKYARAALDVSLQFQTVLQDIAQDKIPKQDSKTRFQNKIPKPPSRQ